MTQDLWCWCDDASGNVRYWLETHRPKVQTLPRGPRYWGGFAYPECIGQKYNVATLCAGEVPEPGEAFHVVQGKVVDVLNVKELVDG